MIDRLGGFAIGPSDRYEALAQCIAVQWSPWIEHETAIEAARAVMSPFCATAHAPDPELVVCEVARSVLGVRRKHWGLGLSDALIESLSAIAQRAYDKALAEGL